jgi:CHAT domain-containing protein
LEIIARAAPGTTDEAGSRNELGLVLRDAGREVEAAEELIAALDALEAQQARLGGGGEARGQFRGRHIAYYRDAIDLLLELDRLPEAVGVLERSRAQGLLAMLAERDMVFTADLPEELAREQRIVRADYQRLLDRLGALAGGDAEATRRVLEEMDAVRLRQDRIRSRIRATAPRLAELHYPENLTLEAAQAMLEPGTVMVYWSLGQARGAVVVMTREAVEARHISAALEETDQRVRAVRRRLALPTTPDAYALPAARALTNALLAPVGHLVEDAERLVLVPDGALWLLPFAALPMPGGEHLVAESTPVSLVASATILKQLRRDLWQTDGQRLEAFGDPVYPKDASQGFTRGLQLTPLPATRSEVTGLGHLYRDSARLHLGLEATEEAVLALGPRSTVVHIAAHGIVDERFPLESAVALSIPGQATEGREDGLLRAWEVFEHLRIDADLVTLSACETALGREVGGEGIVGLTRAFQYAGARTVLASLWSVADESTAELMKRFYTHLKAGMTKDVALQKAQAAFITGPIEIKTGREIESRDFSHPFYWAAFQLIGDWQ